MELKLKSELDKFHSQSQKLSPHYDLAEVGPSILKLTPRFAGAPGSSPRIGFLALVHGNEILGLSVVNELIDRLMCDELQTTSEIYFALGNIPAALKNVRFVDEDLNRSFGLRSEGSAEARRARQLEMHMLNHCDYLIDFHQTAEEAQNAFFIFQYSSWRCLQIIQKINPGIPTILQLDPIGDDQGLASDEFVRLRGGFGTTVELGQFGGSRKYFELAVEVATRALQPNRPFFEGMLKSVPELACPLLHLSYRFQVPDSNVKLNAGIQNLQLVQKGDCIGTWLEKPLLAEKSGFLLFPKYGAPLKPGQTLFFMAEPIRPLDLPVNESKIRKSQDFFANPHLLLNH